MPNLLLGIVEEGGQMIVDRVLIRFPKDFEYFLPAVSVAHEYLMQLQQQQKYFKITVEINDESHLFFSSLFQRMEIIQGGQEPRRQDWDCVLDFRSTERVLRIATPTKRHVTDAWGILFGGSPGKVPQLGYLGARVRQAIVDVIVDADIENGEKLLTFFNRNYPDALVVVDRVNGLRPSTMFDKLCATRMYIGKRSGATYLAATMGKALVELYPTDLPSWWLSKPQWDRYKLIYGDSFSPELIWVFVETIWQNICSSMSQSAMPTGKPVSIAETASAR